MTTYSVSEVPSEFLGTSGQSSIEEKVIYDWLLELLLWSRLLLGHQRHASPGVFSS